METQPNRRGFLKSSTTAAAGAARLSSGIARSAHAAGDDQIKFVLVGCGGRGAGAADQIMNSKGNVKMVAVADAFQQNAEMTIKSVSARHQAKVDVPQDRVFVGLDAYKKAIDVECDLVVIATPPGFKPQQFEYAVNKGKHVFMEKPVASDAPGVRRVLAAVEESKKKNLLVGIGLQRRHEPQYIETVKRIHEGAIGDIIAMRVYWNGGGIWYRNRQPGQTEMAFQTNNWYHFNWLSGDQICEQHIHNIDVANWFIGGHPESAAGMGGRQQRVDKKWGQIYDHHYVEFTYANGVRVNSQCRHQSNTKPDVREEFTGTKGKLYLDNSNNKTYAVDHKGNTIWRYRAGRGADEKGKKGKKGGGGAVGDPNPYQVEHDTLQAAILNNTPINNAYYGAESTMTAVLGRMATYSGQEITWDQALNSKVQHMPAIITAESQPPVKPNAEGWYPIAIPGQKVEGVEIF